MYSTESQYSLKIVCAYLVYSCAIFAFEKNNFGVGATPKHRIKRPGYLEHGSIDSDALGNFEIQNPANNKQQLLLHPANQNQYRQYVPPSAQVPEPQFVKENYPPQSPQILEPQQETNNYFPEQAFPAQQFQPPPNHPVYQKSQPVPYDPYSRQVQKPPAGVFKDDGSKDSKGNSNSDSVVSINWPYLYQSQEQKKCYEDMCVCPMIYNPVCGFDGNPRGHEYPDKGFRTFGNACSFRCSQKCNKYLQFTYCGECSPNHYFPNPGDPAPSISCITDAPIQPQPLVEPQILRREPREGSRILKHDNDED